MLSASLLVAALAIFSAGILSGVTGFGLAVIVVALLVLVYDPKTVVALTGVLSLTVAAAHRKVGRCAAGLRAGVVALDEADDRCHVTCRSGIAGETYRRQEAQAQAEVGRATPSNSLLAETGCAA